MWSRIFIFWIGIIPLWVFNYRFEGPKISLFLVGGLFLAVYWIYRLGRSFALGKVRSNDLWFSLWILILAVAGFTGIDPAQSFLGGSYRHQGVLFFLTLLLTAKTLEILDKKDRKVLTKTVGSVVFFEFALILVQRIFGQVYFGKPLGTIGEANAVAGFLAIGSVFVLESLPRWSLLTLPLSVFLESSRTGVLAFFTFFLTAFQKRLKPTIWIVVALAIAGYVGYMSFNKTFTIFEDRLVYWKLGIRAIEERPLLGYGAESGEEVFRILYKKGGFPLSELIVDRSHNLFLDVAMWTGIVGLIAFSGWLFSEYRGLMSPGRKGAFFTFLVYSFFQPLSIVHWLLFILILRL